MVFWKLNGKTVILGRAMENLETGLVPLALVISLLDDNIASRFPDFLE